MNWQVGDVSITLVRQHMAAVDAAGMFPGSNAEEIVAANARGGGADRIIRGALGIVLAFAALLLTVDTGWRVVLLVLAAVAFFTVVTRYLPDQLGTRPDTCRDRTG